MRVLSKLEGKKKAGNQWVAKCPSHDDHQPSLSIGLGTEDRVLLTCHAGCDLDQILAAVDMTVTDLFPPETNTPEVHDRAKDQVVATYDYHDADGELVMQVLRYIRPDGRKTFRQRRPDSRGGWVWNTSNLDKPLYRLPQVLRAAAQGVEVWVCEGEKDVHTLEEFGLVATTNPGGASKWQRSWSEPLLGCPTVTIVVDNDEPGVQHGLDIAKDLTELGIEHRLLKAPGKYKDASQFLHSGGTVDGFVGLDHVPEVEPSPFLEIRDLVEDLSESDRSDESKISRLVRSIERITVKAEPLEIQSWSKALSRPLPPEDWIIPNFLERGERVVLVAPEGVGKLADVNTLIPTPLGWRKLGEIRVDDLVFDQSGTPTRVVAVSGVEIPRCHEIRFSDGATVVAADTHRWVTVDYPGRQETWKPGIRTTQEIRDTLFARRGHTLNHAIECCGPIQYAHQILPVDPWLLGYWLGDGAKSNAQISVGSADLDWFIGRLGSLCVDFKSSPKNQRVSISELKVPLRDLGVLDNKHIPEIYLRSSVEQRLELLRGLLDSDGYIPPETSGGRGKGASTIEWVSCAPTDHNPLADGFMDLVWGLGIKATRKSSDAKLRGRTTSRRQRVHFQTALPVFSLPRKLKRITPLRTRRAQLRYVTAVEEVEPRPCVCIQVESPSSTYLLGDRCIPTHNSMLARQIAICTSMGINWLDGSLMNRGMNTLTVDLENPPRLILRKSELIYKTAIGMVTSDFREPPPQGRAELIMHPQGLNVLNATDRARLEDAVIKTEPDLILLGPLYKSFIDPGNRTSEAVVELVTHYFDYLRIEYNTALWFEHHPPLGESMTSRPLRPFGSSVWSRWPEFGLTLSRDFDKPGEYVVGTFRGSRDERRIPKRLQRAVGLPFMVTEF